MCHVQLQHIETCLDGHFRCTDIFVLDLQHILAFHLFGDLVIG